MIVSAGIVGDLFRLAGWEWCRCVALRISKRKRKLWGNQGEITHVVRHGSGEEQYTFTLTMYLERAVSTLYEPGIEKHCTTKIRVY